jgi:hypothetical protein
MYRTHKQKSNMTAAVPVTVTTAAVPVTVTTAAVLVTAKITVRIFRKR